MCTHIKDTIHSLVVILYSNVDNVDILHGGCGLISMLSWPHFLNLSFISRPVLPKDLGMQLSYQDYFLALCPILVMDFWSLQALTVSSLFKLLTILQSYPNGLRNKARLFLIELYQRIKIHGDRFMVCSRMKIKDPILFLFINLHQSQIRNSVVNYWSLTSMINFHEQIIYL